MARALNGVRGGARTSETFSLEDLSDDLVHAALEELARQPGRCYMGKDVDGRAIYKAKEHTIAPATVNRYAAALASVLTGQRSAESRPAADRSQCLSCQPSKERRQFHRCAADG